MAIFVLVALIGFALAQPGGQSGGQGGMSTNLKNI